MSEAVDVIKREIARRQTEIAALTAALNALLGSVPQETRRKAPRAPKEGDASINVFTVNGHDIRLGRKAFAVLETVNGAEDCCSLETLLPIFDGNRVYVQQAVSVLNKKLRGAGAEIVWFKGEGYRLQNIEETGA